MIVPAMRPGDRYVKYTCHRLPRYAGLPIVLTTAELSKVSVTPQLTAKRTARLYRVSVSEKPNSAASAS